jgi:hypothetical protein
MIYFIYFVFINEFKESKYLSGELWKNIQNKSIVSKKFVRKGFLLSAFIQKGLQKFIKSLSNWIQIPTITHFPSLCCHQGISVPRMTT